MADKQVFTMDNLQNIFKNINHYRLIVKNAQGSQFLNIPLLLAVIVVVLAPKLSILAAIVGFFKRMRVTVVAPRKQKSNEHHSVTV
jgi:broad specificity polyphosphatase/5'/3'-nucleotidase SurE